MEFMCLAHWRSSLKITPIYLASWTCSKITPYMVYNLSCLDWPLDREIILHLDGLNFIPQVIDHLSRASWSFWSSIWSSMVSMRQESLQIDAPVRSRNQGGRWYIKETTTDLGQCPGGRQTSRATTLIVRHPQPHTAAGRAGKPRSTAEFGHRCRNVRYFSEGVREEQYRTPCWNQAQQHLPAYSCRTSASGHGQLSVIGSHTSVLCGLVGLDLINDDTRPSGHISRPTQVNVSQICFHSLNNYLSLITLYTSGG